jgi:thiamine-monophosphate kinase
MLARWGDLARGIGDDAAELDVPPGERLVVSTDSSVEGSHFRRDWLTPEEIGWRATASALSDLAAMAARPLGLVLALCLPDDWRGALDGLADGVGAAARAAGAPIVGGDLVRGSELALTVTVLGSAASPLGRGGARAGDLVCVTGALGGPRCALAAWVRGERPAVSHRARFARPMPRLDEARWLAVHGASAMVDVSDGLAADLGHVAAASGVRIVLDPSRVPRVDGATLADALGGGEEYELALTLPGRATDPGVLDAFMARFALSLTIVGRVLAVDGGRAAHAGASGVVLDAGADAGERVDLPSGHDHFSS